LRVTSWRFFSAFSRRFCCAAIRSVSARAGSRIALGDGRHLLGARAELMALQPLERRLDLREPGLERLGSLPPLAAMIVAAHRRT
jgi:hypothetical protein